MLLAEYNGARTASAGPSPLSRRDKLGLFAMAWLLATAGIFGDASEAAAVPYQPRTAACILPATLGSGLRYPVRLRITGDNSRTLGSGVVTISRADGSRMASIDCARPLIFMQLPAGKYVATIDAAAGPSPDISFSVTRSASGRTIDVHLRPSVPLLIER